MNSYRDCSHCGQFREMSKGGAYLRNVCKPCWNIQQKAWRSKNAERWAELKKRHHEKKRASDPAWCERIRAKGRKYWADLRRAALDRYGHACACCGETIDEFLSI